MYLMDSEQHMQYTIVPTIALARGSVWQTSAFAMDTGVAPTAVWSSAPTVALAMDNVKETGVCVGKGM